MYNGTERQLSSDYFKKCMFCMDSIAQFVLNQILRFFFVILRIFSSPTISQIIKNVIF